MSFPEESLPGGWRTWADEADGRTILVYRPDVFDADRYPSACLPTIYLTDGSPRPRPGAGQRHTDEWTVRLFAEPEIELASETHGDRETAVDAALAIAERFTRGEVDYRGAYQVPREKYLDKLDELTGTG